jgi:hypothetical protein
VAVAVFVVVGHYTPVEQQLAALFHPSSSSSSPSVFESNTTLTLLNAACATACLGGNCTLYDRSSSGSLLCVTCPVGAVKVRNGTKCSLTRECTSQPWCSSADASLAVQLHNTLVSFALNVSSLPVPYTHPALNTLPQWASIRFAYDHTHLSLLSESARAQSVVDLLNLFLSAKTSMLLHGDTRSPLAYLDDESSFWTNSSLEVYSTAMPADYALYVLALKRRTCLHAWQPNLAKGGCQSPSLFSPDNHRCGVSKTANPANALCVACTVGAAYCSFTLDPTVLQCSGCPSSTSPGVLTPSQAIYASLS